MQYVVLALLYLLVPMIFTLVDRRIKGCRSVLYKIVSVIAIMTALYLAVYFYGRQILSTFRINIKSFTSIKAFFSSRILVWIGLLIFFILVVFKFVFLRISFKEMKRTLTSSEKVFSLVTIFFDLVLIPDIFTNNSLFAVFALLSVVEIGLVYLKLVFSIDLANRKEVLA